MAKEKEFTICPKCGREDAWVETDPKWPHRVLIYCQCYKKGKVAAVRMDRKDLPRPGKAALEIKPKSLPKKDDG